MPCWFNVPAAQGQRTKRPEYATDQLWQLTLFSTSNPANRHSWNSFSKFNTKSAVHFETYHHGKRTSKIYSPMDDKIGLKMYERFRQEVSSWGTNYVLLQSLSPDGFTFMWQVCCGLCPWHKQTELAHSFLFYSCIYFCLYGPFNCISFQNFSRQL